MRIKPRKFKLKLLTASISSIVFAASGAFSQDSTVEEEVIVTGMRASLEAAMDIKRESTGVVDAISAEDIGKMPDTNLAESLQRIAGVSISRTNGEGAQVTVRGIDPSMNMVTLNGRNMPAVTNNGTIGDKSSRAFDFANLASEGINGVEVYKTGKATVSGGGLGATINLKTIRPLDLGELKASIGVKGVHDETVSRSTEGNDYTPEVSGIYSWLNDDATFGVTFTASYQERDNSRSNSYVNNWQFQTAGAPTLGTRDGTIPDTAAVTNQPALGQHYALPTDLRYALEDNHRERTNSQLTFQFRPIESVTATLDYTYSDNNLEADRAQQSAWFNISAITELEFDTNVEVLTPLIYVEAYPAGGKDVSFAQLLFASESQSNSIGFNVEWDATDNLSLEFDYHDSTANNVTTQTEVGLNANVVTGEYANWGRDLPVMGITFDDSDPAKGNDNGILDGGDISSAMGSVAYDRQDTEIKQTRLLGELDLGGFTFFEESSLAFGFEQRSDENVSFVNGGTTPRITMGNWGGVDPDTFGSDWPAYFTARNFGDGFPDYGSTASDPNFLSNGLDGNIGAIIENIEWVYAQGIDPANFNNFPNGRIQANAHVDTNRTISEDITSAYVQFHGEFMLAERPANLVIGLRHESTDITSTSIVAIPQNQQWDGDDDWSLVAGTGLPESYSNKNSYDNLLPNIDFDINITEDIKLRTSYSQTMARPSYGQLKSDVTIDNLLQKQASGGNPYLEPLESENLDISSEWYYDDSSYVSIAYFRKDVSNFIGTVVEGAEVYGLRDIREGPRLEQAIADIIAAGGNPNSLQEQHNQMLINEGLDPADESTFVRPNSSDPVQIWDKTQPNNFRDDTIDGFELSVQHWFGESGYGIQANYTSVDSGLEVDNTATYEQFALIGLSDTANLVAFYDKGALQARIAYNWRDSYLKSLTQGGNNAPGYVDTYSQIDFSVSYAINDNVTISGEGINITGEDSREYGRSERQMFSMEDLGARYQLGVRVTY